MRAIEIRKDIEASVLREAAKVEKDSNVCRRLLGLSHLLEGGTRKEAERIACLSESNFRIWIKRVNELGIDGLKNKCRLGRPRKISNEIKEALKEKVLQGPFEGEGIVRYRIVDLQKFLQEKYGISMGISGVWYNLQALGLTWKTGRQRHPKSDEMSQETFKKTFLPS